MQVGIELRSALAAAAVVASAHSAIVQQLGAQTEATCSDLSDLALAQQYAPELLFGPGELDFPVMPFFTAFDGRDNDPGGEGEGQVDFEDLEEIAPLVFEPARPGASPSSRVESLASWDALYEARTKVVRGGGTPESAVFYRVRPLSSSETRELWRFLRKDPQAWHRNQMDSLWPPALRRETSFRVVEYYLYYLNDSGLEGHPEDIEFVFVFVPSGELRCKFRVTVGAGHVHRTPNNVLVEFDEEDPLSIFVELGGHASAPDRRPPGRGVGDGRFEVGYDVNWHAADVWGTRDVLATTGIGFSGPYKPEYTLSRENDAVSFQWARPGVPRGYRLLPVEPFARLSALLEPSDPDRGLLIDTLEEIELALSRDATTWGTFSAPETLEDDQIRRMQTWNRDLWTANGDRLGATRHQIWEHRHYRLSPVLILKEHLYQPSFSAISTVGDVIDLITYGSSAYPGEGWGAHVGLVIPTIRFPVRLPGLVQLQFGFVRDWAGNLPSRLSLSVLYDSHYRELLGWYAKIGYVKNREDLFPDGTDGPGDFTVSAGVTLLPWSWSQRRTAGVPLLPHSVRLRVGPRVGLKGWDDMLDGIGLEVIASLRH